MVALMCSLCAKSVRVGRRLVGVQAAGKLVGWLVGVCACVCLRKSSFNMALFECIKGQLKILPMALSCEIFKKLIKN